MRKLFPVISIVALIGVIAPPVLFLLGCLELPQVHRYMLIATVVWFVLTPLWMGKSDPSAE